MQLYENGGIGITAIGATEIDKVLDPANALHEELVSAPELSLEYIVFNTNAAPFDDAKVRQALCYALDKEKIVNILTKNTVSAASGILPPGIPGYDENFSGIEFNVSKAQELINESSYRDGLPSIVLSVSGSCAGLPAVDEAIAYMWKENLGINVTLEAIDFSTLIDDASAGKLQAFELGWIADYPDAENFLDLLFHCGAVENHGGYCNQSVDALLEQARVEADPVVRLELYRQAQTAIVDDAPCLPLWFGQNYYLVKSYVKGFEPAPMIIPWMKDVWIAQ
jgi:oligopeptide transport system substrate-binding protein